MKKIVSLILAAAMFVFGGIVASAATTEISFPMINTTGIIYLNGTSEIITSDEPITGVEDSITITTSGAIPTITSVALEVQGKKFGNNYLTTDRYLFENYDSLTSVYPNANGTGEYWKLRLYDHSAPAGSFLVANFNAIYSFKIIATGNFETKSEKVYNEWGTTIKTSDAVPAFVISESFLNHTMVTDCITAAINGVKSFNFATKEVKYDYAFIGDTDVNNNGIVERNEVVRLSYSELGEGKGLPGFEGLASQVCAFFSHKNNGQIIFNLTTADAPLATTWEWGGIPSTQVGIFAAPERISNDIIGLFFNYSSTGSLLAQGKIDNSRIIFDMSDVLNELGGYTNGVLENIYYGFIGGINYTGYGKGLKIESVVLVSDEEEEVIDTTVEIGSTDDDEEDVTIEVVEEEVVIDETSETEITTPDIVLVEDTDEQVVVTPSDKTNVAGEDENPRTGAGLVVLPAILLGAVVGITRKRR